jgi:hypothetical protein
MQPLTCDAMPILISVVACQITSPVLAYIGPGAGLSAIGAFLAIVAFLIVALFGFVWYPIKRLLRMRRSRRDEKGAVQE